MYKIDFTKIAEKQFFKLSTELQIRINKVLDRITIRPEQYLEHLSGVPYFKLRAGDYRLIIDLQKDRLIILIIKIGRRENVYDDL